MDFPEHEGHRAEVFEQLHGTWPPPFTYPGRRPREETESAGWARAMQDFEDEARRETGQWRFERYLELAQMHLAKNYTATGYHHTALDSELHRQAAEKFAVAAGGSYQPRTAGNTEEAVPFYVSGERDFWSCDHLGPALREGILRDIQGRVAAWAVVEPDDLELRAYYGFRIYLNGSVLRSHVDVVDTHVLSAVYCLGLLQEAGAPAWRLGSAVGFDGGEAWVDLRPGELFLYESAKLPHGRPTEFVGERYAALFVHFQPREWRLANTDRIYALPPGWNDEEPAADEGARAEL